MTNNVNNGGLPQQKIPGGSIRQEAIKTGANNVDEQLNLMGTTKGGTKGGKRRKTIKRQKRRKMRGGVGSPISPPIAPNTGPSQSANQNSYGGLAALSGSVQENSRYDTPPKVGGKKYKSRKNRKTKKHTKRRKYY